MNITKLIVTVLMAIVIFGCKKEDEVPNLGTLEVQLTLSSGLTDIPLTGISVTITSSVDNASTELSTDGDGKVTFENIAVGTYNVVVAHSTDDYTISGTANDVFVQRQTTAAQTITVNAVNPTGGLVIKEVYTSGSGFVTLYKDEFVEIFNNSSEVQYADGMYIANVFGNSGQSGDVAISSILDITQYVYSDVISQIPGSGQDYPVAPGKSIVIALNAVNYKEGSATPNKEMNNTDATLEHYSIDWLEAQGRTGNAFFETDNPAVPNMINTYMFAETNFFRLTPAEASIVLISSDVTFSDGDIVDYTAPGSSSTFKVMRIPVNKVVDGVDILNNSSASSFKRLTSSIDAGFNYVNPDGAVSFTGLSSRRKKDEVATKRFGRVILLDTDNSTVDFEAIDFPDKYGYNQ